MGGGTIPKFQYWFRKVQGTKSKPLKVIYKALFAYYRNKNCNDFADIVNIGPGAYFGHPYCIVINQDAVIGSNVNIHKGVTIGRENRGKRQGAPVIGNDVWIGINATIVGKVHVGNDVLIAPNSYVNFDIPDHSIVLGNPAKIISKENATEGYIENRVSIES